VAPATSATRPSSGFGFWVFVLRIGPPLHTLIVRFAR
jgi:hypothetical protein